MTTEFIHAQDVFLDKINRICSKIGLNNIMAQLYAILYLGSDPVSLNDMVERLKISKGSASINIRALERYGAVRRVWVKGSRKDYYEAETDIAKVITDRLKSMGLGRLEEIDDMIDSSYEALKELNPLTGGEEKKGIEIFKERLDHLKGLHIRARSLFDLFNSNLFNDLLDAKVNKDDKESLNAEIGPRYEGVR